MRKPTFLGIRTFSDYSLEELAAYIDWTPFFQTWELSGRFPGILTDSVVGEVATSLYADAQKMLKQIVEEKWFTAKATIGFWPANAVGDDIRLYADDTRINRDCDGSTRCASSSRSARAASNAALSDFIAPKTSNVPDYIGGFVVTAGLGEDIIADRFKNANDDYSSILCKALADRLAEAFAERMHERVRKEFWAYAPDENISTDDLILEKYQGIRPAPGYPAQPDHTEKATIFKLLDAENTAGVTAHRKLRHVAGLVGVRALFQPSRELLFRRRQDRARSGRGICRAQEHERGRGGTLAGAGAELHSGCRCRACAGRRTRACQ